MFIKCLEVENGMFNGTQQRSSDAREDSIVKRSTFKRVSISVSALFLSALGALAQAQNPEYSFAGANGCPGKGGQPVVRQIASNVTGVSVSGSSLSVQFSRPTLPGSAIWVVVSSPDHDYSSPFVFQVADTQRNHYQFVGQKNDFNNGIQSVADFIAFFTHGGGAEGETVTFTLTEDGTVASDNYLGIFVAEVTGVDSDSFTHSENNNVDPPEGIDQVSSGPMTAHAPVFVLAASMNVDGGASDTGGSGYGGPAASADLIEEGPIFWAMDGTVPLSTFETGVLTPSAGSVTAYFASSPEPAASVSNKNEYVTVAIALPLHEAPSR